MDFTCTQLLSNKIFHLNSKILSFDSVTDLRKILKNQSKETRIALNLKNIDYVSADFLEFLKEYSTKQKLSLIETPSEIFALLNLTHYDKFANLFVSEADFISQTGMILNRRFSLVGNF